MRRPSLVERFRAYLPVTDATPDLGRGEGSTPLVPAARLGAAIGVPGLHLKVEGQNPTGSFKDRGMVLAVAKAAEEGARAIICASTGNTSASAATYGAAAGLEVVVVLPRGRIAMGKLLQARVAGARVVAVDGNFDAALRIVRELAARPDHPVTLVNSLNPYRIEGQKTAAFEVCDDLGGSRGVVGGKSRAGGSGVGSTRAAGPGDGDRPIAPEILAIPVGNAGNITAYWQGFREYAAAGRIERLPRMWGFQAAGAAPIVLGHPVEAPETVATAIRIGNPASWARAVAARDASGGRIEAVTDDEILAAHHDLARLEGIFCEPSSAASVAGVARLAAEGAVPAGATVVCVLTGNGLKDPETAERQLTGGPSILETAATTEAVREALRW